MIASLAPDRLARRCAASTFSFTTTAELPPVEHRRRPGTSRRGGRLRHRDPAPGLQPLRDGPRGDRQAHADPAVPRGSCAARARSRRLVLRPQLRGSTAPGRPPPPAGQGPSVPGPDRAAQPRAAGGDPGGLRVGRVPRPQDGPRGGAQGAPERRRSSTSSARLPPKSVALLRTPIGVGLAALRTGRCSRPTRSRTCPRRSALASPRRCTRSRRSWASSSRARSRAGSARRARPSRPRARRSRSSRRAISSTRCGGPGWTSRRSSPTSTPSSATWSRTRRSSSRRRPARASCRRCSRHASRTAPRSGATA